MQLLIVCATSHRASPMASLIGYKMVLSVLLFNVLTTYPQI